jgi:outer membrane murein-binding lipoprotein Lpp
MRVAYRPLYWEASLVADPSSSKKEECKMSSARKCIANVVLTIAGGLSLSACATEDYVDKHIAIVNDRVTALEARVQQVDTTAQAAAASAQSANQRIDQLTARVDGIEQRLASKPARN